MKRTLLSLALAFLVLFPVGAEAAIADFENLNLATESYWNGSNESGGFVSGDASFSNYYDTYWGSWDGWAYSNMTDTTTPGWSNQYSAITGSGVAESSNYGVAYDAGSWGGASPPLVSFGASTGVDYDTTINGAFFTNTTYAYLSMRDGDDYATAFQSGDWQKMIVTGIDVGGNYTASTVELPLADFTSPDPNDWYILDEWTYVDMTGLGDIIGFELDFDGSQVSNVPAYVAMDNVNAVPVPGAVWLFGSGLLGLIGIRKKPEDLRKERGNKMKKRSHLFGLVVFLVSLFVCAGTTRAALYADVLCYYEQGINANAGYWTPENAVSPDGTTKPSGLVSLGGWTDDPSYGVGNPTGLLLGFSTSIANGSGNDLYVHGNGFPGWYEHGYIQVAQESTGFGATVDGWMDEEFYLIKPSNYDSLPNDPRTAPIPMSYFDGNETGYADIGTDGEKVDIDWAMNMAGDLVDLTDIAYVRTRTVTDDAAGIFGYYTTEIDYVEALNGTAAVPIPGAVWLFGSGLVALLGIRKRKAS
jgi:hypothetical protein